MLRKRQVEAWGLSGLMLTLCVVFALMLSSCTRTETVYVPHNYVPKGITREQMRDVIMQVTREQGWWLDDRNPGMVKAVYREDEKVAEIEIAYNAAQYTIYYHNSSSLHDEANGFYEIKPPYNEWVRKLEQAINECLETVQTQQLSQPIRPRR